MDLSLLPPSVSEYNQQRTGARFTVRSANSPSYSLTRRTGVRKRETAEEAGERQGTHTSANVTSKEEQAVTGYQAKIGSRSSVKDECDKKEASGYKMPTGLNHDGRAGKTIPESGTDRSENAVFESRGRTEWRRGNLSSRSRSLDWGAGAGSPDRGTRAGMSALSSKRGGDISKQSAGLEERRAGAEGGTMGRVMFSVQAYNSVRDRNPKSNTSQTLDRTSRGNSLPSRLRSQSGPGSRFTDSLSGPKGGQSILERIEKLYGSAGFGKAEDFSSDTRRDSLLSPTQRTHEKTAGGTFPRRFSAGDYKSPVQSKMSFIWPQKDTSGTETSLSPGTSSTRERSPGGRWQGQIQGRYSEEGGVNWRKGFMETGTRSLDRARSRCTVAAQIRAARAAAGISASAQPNILLEETSDSFRDFSGFRERRASGSKVGSRVNYGEEKTDGINGMLKERTEKIHDQKKEKETDDGAKEKTELKSSAADEDVFDSNPQKTAERKLLPVRSAASVRNKINQFEALTQRSQGLATGQVLMPRRAFSVPTQLNRGYDGVKKSGSAKEIGGLRNKWERLKEGVDKSEDEVMGTGKNLGSERSLSVDEVGLRLEKRETGGKDLVGEGKNNSSDDFGKYSKLKNELEIPLNEGDQRETVKFAIDEKDFSKVSSPEEPSEGDRTVNTTPTSLLSCDTPAAGVQGRTDSEITSPVSDEDKTPTNNPDHFIFISPTSQPDDAPPVTDSENKSTPVLTQADSTPDPDSPPLLRPLATSSHSNLPDLISPDVKTAVPKGKKRVLDLDAWVAGLNPEFKVWNDEEDDYEDDDESTQKDEDSNYDSDSGESSVTITSNMSQSDRRSFCVSLSDLCYFAGADDESENDSDEWQSIGRRSASLSSDVSALSCVSVLPAEELDKLLEDVRSLGDNTLQDYNEVQVVVLHKEVGVGLGFSLAGGVDQNKPVTVHKVFHSGIAAQEGSIREGDQVLSINGSELSGRAHWEALRVLRRAKTRDMGVVVLRRGDVTGASKRGVQGKNLEPKHTQYETGNSLCLKLQKNSRDLGFSLQGGEGSTLGNRPLSVQKVFLGGPVDQVYPGDEILEIEGRSMVGMRRLEAWTLIRRLPPGPVDVVLRRPPKHQET